MVAAIKEELSKQTENYQAVQRLQDLFLTKISSLNYYINHGKEQLPYVLNLGFPGQKNDLLLLRMDLAGISISTGSACTAGIVQTSHVLKAFYGNDSHRLQESVRISLSPQNTDEEIIQLVNTLKEIIGD